MSEHIKSYVDSDALVSTTNFKVSSLLEGNEYPLLGNSEVMVRIKKQIEFASRVSFPTFISGESGTEKRSVAYHIHLNRNGNSDGFVYVPANMHDLAGYKYQLTQGINHAKGGTLYLSEIDNLNAEQKDYLIGLFTLGNIQEKLNRQETYLIISCTEPLLAANSCTQFLAKLLGHSTPHLELFIPPLRQRKDDIPLHVQHIVTLLSSNLNVHISSEAKLLLTEFEWPGNINQLQRVLMVLMSCHLDDEINVDDIGALNILKRKHVFPDVIDAIGRQDFSELRQLHPALLKALKFMGEHFREEISLADLSNASYASSSHLSFLFREYLGHSFKTILVQLRIRYAQECIMHSPMLQITDICLRSGFGDLSHFEKMFKRYVGCNPRQYRQHQREENCFS